MSREQEHYGDRPKCLDGGRFRRSISDRLPLQRQSTLPTPYILPIPKQSDNPQPIHFQSKTNPSIKSQSCTNPPIHHQHTKMMPICQYNANLIILDKSNPWKICQSITNPSIQRQFCTNQCVPIHHQSANPLPQGPIPNHQMAPPHIYQHQS